MPVPKRKRSRARRDKRFANKGIQIKAIATCPNCKEPRATHQVCSTCGHYKGVKVMTTKSERTLKRAESNKARESRRAVHSKAAGEPESSDE